MIDCSFDSVKITTLLVDNIERIGSVLGKLCGLNSDKEVVHEVFSDCIPLSTGLFKESGGSKK